MAALPEDFNILAMALESTNSGVVITDYRQADNPIIFCNHAFENLTGYSREEVTGRNCRFLQGDDLLQDALIQLSEAVKNGAPVTVELRNYQKNGTMFWNELSIAPVRDPEGTVTHFIGIQTDITRKKMTETDLMEQIDFLNNRLEKQAKYINKIEEILFGIMHTSRECLVVLDQDLLIIKANANFYDIFNETEADVIGHSFEQIQLGQWIDPELHSLLNDAHYKNKAFEGFSLHLSKLNEKCKEVTVSGNKLQVPGIPKDFILVNIRCKFIGDEHKSRLELTSH